MAASSTATAPASASALSHGQAISYKAFGRNFTQDQQVGVLYLMATCFYPTNGFTIFFEPVSGDSAKFNLMEQSPTGIFLNLVTYYAQSGERTGCRIYSPYRSTSRSWTRRASTESAWSLAADRCLSRFAAPARYAARKARVLVL